VDEGTAGRDLSLGSWGTVRSKNRSAMLPIFTCLLFLLDSFWFTKLVLRALSFH